MEEEKIAYSPTKNYEWDENETFTFTGPEFSFLINNIRQEVYTIEGLPIINKVRIHELLEQKLREAVEEGRARETVSKVVAPKLASV